MSPSQTPISRAISDVLTGYYSRKRLTQEVVAERSGMSIVTLQKKLKANAPISATDLVVISRAIGVEPAKVLEDALAEVAESERQVSDVPVSLKAHREKKSVKDMTDDEIDALKEKAAIYDTDLEQDEPELP